MDLERLSLRLRPRSEWEAVDLGLAMVRTWFKPVYRIWLILMLPLGLCLTLWLGTWGGLIFWWLLPLGQVAVLKTLSHQVFGQPPGLKETLRTLPGLWRRGLPELALRRFHPSRSLRLAIGQLEGLTGKEHQSRVLVFNSRGQESPSGLPLVFLAFEAGLALSFILLMLWMLPDGFGFDGELFTDRFFDGDSPIWVYRGFWAIVALSILFLDPLYVGVGFALYLNRRTQLEGWDLEIALRRLVRRVENRPEAAAVSQLRSSEPTPNKADEPPSSHGSQASAVGAVALLALLGMIPGPSQAQWKSSEETSVPEIVIEAPLFDSEWTGQEDQDPRGLISEIMQRPELKREKTEITWSLREDLFKRKTPEEDPQPPPDFGWFETIAALFVALVEPLLWIGASILVLLLLRAIWQHLPDDAPERREDILPERILGLDLKPDSLPEDVASEAEQLWRSGQPVAALSLLYRGALIRLVQEGIGLRESFTENDCLQSARKSLVRPRVDFLADLTRTWQLVAYGHRLPDEERARWLWSHWDRHFSSSQPAPNSAEEGTAS